MPVTRNQVETVTNDGITHVVNATRFPIWVSCDSDRVTLTEESRKVSDAFAELNKNIREEKDHGRGKGGGGNWLFNIEVEAEYEKQRKSENEHSKSGSSSNEYAKKMQVLHVANSKGFTKILSEEYGKFAMPRDQRVYVSIILETFDGGLDMITTAHSISANHSLIVRHDGALMWKGTTNTDLFIDEQGNDLQRALWKVQALFEEKRRALAVEDSDPGAPQIFDLGLRAPASQIVKRAECQPHAANSTLSVGQACGQRTLQSTHGTYLRAYNTGNKVDMAGSAQDWEHWHVQPNEGKVIIKSIHPAGLFLRAHPNKHVDLDYNVSDSERWLPFKYSDGWWSFRSFHGHWLSANRDASVRCVDECGSSEKFWLGNW